MVGLFYKNLQLGQLTYDDSTKEFVYNSKVKNEQKAKEKYHKMEFYFLYDSVNRRQKELFEDFSIFASNFNRPDIIEMAQLKETDSVYEKLEKISTLSFLENDFYIKYIEK